MNIQTNQPENGLPNATNRYGAKLDLLSAATENKAELPLLGAVCWFDLRSGASRTELERALQNDVKDPVVRGIIEDNLPPYPKPEQSFAYAIANAATGLKGIQTTKLEGNASKHVASILDRREQDSGNGVDRVDYVQRSRVALLLTDRAGSVLANPIIAHEVKGDPVGQRIENLYSWHRDHLTPDDIRPMVTGVFVAASRLILRRAGGTYFVPEQKLDIIRELFGLLRVVRCSGYFLPIFETTEALETLGECATEDAIDDVAALIDELEQFDAALDEGKLCRAATLESRLEKLDDLRSKATLYSRLLKHDVQAIEAKMQQAEEKLLAVITKRDHLAK